MPFPLPEAPVDTVIGLYSQFDDVELAAIVESSGDVVAHDDPVQHLLSLHEQPHLKLFEDQIGREAGSIVAYRSAVCLGATMLRRFARDKGIDLSELQVNPGRNYLFFPDLPLSEARQRYGAWPIMTEDFSDPHYYRRFFQSDASAERVRGLQHELAANHVGFMEDDRPGRSAENFGFFCRGLLDTFELYAHLRRERNVAPRDQVFDADKHQILSTFAPWATGDTKPDLALRWRVGGLVTMRLCGETALFDEQLGNTSVADRRGVIGLARGIGGFVAGSEAPDSPAVPVLFKRSEERFGLERDDILLVRDSNSKSGIFSTLRYPFLVEQDTFYPQAEVAALCRDGQIRFLYDPAIDLDKEETSLADAIHFAMLEG